MNSLGKLYRWLVMLVLLISLDVWCIGSCLGSRWRSWVCGWGIVNQDLFGRGIGIWVLGSGFGYWCCFLFAGRVAGLRLVYVTLCHESSSANTKACAFMTLDFGSVMHEECVRIKINAA